MLPEVREKRKDFSREKSKISINFIVMIIIYNKCSQLSSLGHPTNADSS